jgi:hypothetical protein
MNKTNDNPKCPECKGEMVKNGKAWRGRTYTQRWICNQAPPKGCGNVIYVPIEIKGEKVR